MTNLPTAQINEDIALHLGWIETGFGAWGNRWAHPDTSLISYDGPNPRRHPPDFCGDWAHAGPLYERMLNEGLIVEIRIIPDGIGQSIYFCNVCRQVRNDLGVHRVYVSEGRGRKVEEAIARAYHATFVVKEGE